MKPMSEIDMAQFKPTDKVSSSYYLLPKNYPQPVCTGRYFGVRQGILNNEYAGISTSSESFKLKQKQEYEDNLFKNEDAMYQIDF